MAVFEVGESGSNADTETDRPPTFVVATGASAPDLDWDADAGTATSAAAAVGQETFAEVVDAAATAGLAERGFTGNGSRLERTLVGSDVDGRFDFESATAGVDATWMRLAPITTVIAQETGRTIRRWNPPDRTRMWENITPPGVWG
ncbi:hypothetical protein ACWDXH_31705 [Micromonospora chokoriensis]